MSNVAKKDGASYWIRVAIWLILSFAGWLTPAVGPVTDYGMKILFIFVGLMFGWICLDLIYPSFLSVVLVAIASGEPASTFFYAGFSSEIVVVIIVLTTFIAYANKVASIIILHKNFSAFASCRGDHGSLLRYLCSLSMYWA